MRPANAKHRDDVVISLFEEFCVRVSTPLSLDALTTVKSDPMAFKALKIDASLYSSATSFARDLQVLTFVKKYTGLPGASSDQRRKNAEASWLEAEKRCFRTNVRLCADAKSGFAYPPLGRARDGSLVYLSRIISDTQVKIARALGRLDVGAMLSNCRWSGGATSDLRRGTPYYKKMSSMMAVTSRALPHLREVVSEDLLWVESILGFAVDGPTSPLVPYYTLTDANRYIVVPKNAYTDRSIGAEPTGNAFLQQAVGRSIRSSLKRVGVDLDFGHRRNKMLAKLAVSMSLSTIDLESASDTVAYCLVKLLLPPEWFEFLSDLRCAVTRDGKSGRRTLLEKFSSMGNAFTFELESLIFWALSASVAESFGYGDLKGVFGDDIIQHREVYDETVAVLSYCGFSINRTKSFRDGPFFESCGGQYFAGRDVTPFHLDDPVIREADYISFHNKVYRWQERVFGSQQPWLADVMEFLKGFSKTKVPATIESDGGMITSPFRGYYSKNHGYLCRVLTEKTSYNDVDSGGQLLAYAYKMRRGRQHQNERVNGHPGERKKQYTVERIAWLYPPAP